MKTNNIYVLYDTVMEEFSLPMAYPSEKAFVRGIEALFSKDPSRKDSIKAYCVCSIDTPNCSDDFDKLQEVAL